MIQPTKKVRVTHVANITVITVYHYTVLFVTVLHVSVFFLHTLTLCNGIPEANTNTSKSSSSRNTSNSTMEPCLVCFCDFVSSSASLDVL